MASKNPRYISKKTRTFVMERDGHKCVRCGVNDELVIHHILPVSEGGGSEPENLQVLCMGCHKAVHIERGDEYAFDMASTKSNWLSHEPEGAAFYSAKVRASVGVCEELGITESQMQLLGALVSGRVLRPNLLGLAIETGRDELNVALDLLCLREQNLVLHTNVPEKFHYYRANKDTVGKYFKVARFYYDEHKKLIAAYDYTPYGEKPRLLPSESHGTTNA